MAFFEKNCECNSGNCKYHGGDMFKFKHNHLQINPECRHKFKGLKARAVIVLRDNNKSPWTTYVYKHNQHNHTEIIYDYHYKHLVKWYGRLYDEKEEYGQVKLFDKNTMNIYYSYPLRRKDNLLVAVHVEGYDNYFYNFLDGKKSLRAFRKNMRKLFGYDIDITTNLKYNQIVDPNKLIDCYFGDF